MQLPGFPNLPPEVPGTRIFRAWGYWGRNVRGWPVVAVAIATLLLALGGVLVGVTRAVSWVPMLLIVTGIGVPLALYPGKVAALYPYAVEVDEGKGLRFYCALGDAFFPMNELRGVRWSWVYGAWVVSLNRRYGLLSGFLIHFAWGKQGRELVRAIEEELARKASP
jgi:hypothetical protein